MINKINALVLFINIATVIAMFVTSTGKLIDKRRAWYNLLTKRGWIFLACCLVLVFMPIFQNNYLQSQAKLEQDERDKNMRTSYNLSLREFKHSYDSTSKDIIKTLAQYGLEYNTAQKRIEKLIRDSTGNTIIQSENPTLDVNDYNEKGIELVKKDSMYTYKITLISHDAASTDIDITVSALISLDFVNFSFYNSGKIFGSRVSLPKEGAKSAFFTVDKSDGVNKYKYFVICARGTYKNRDGTKKYNLNDVYYYNVVGNTFGTIENETKERVINIVKQKEKI